MAVKLSVTSKLDGIKSWSLNAIDTCPGSVAPKASGSPLVDACSGCYATTGNYRLSNVRAPREHNKEDWPRDEWVDDMVAALQGEQFFRWLDSGDLYDIRLARKVRAVMAATPWVKHWLPTRMYKFFKFRPILDAMRTLPNVSVRFSSDSVLGAFTPGVHGSTIIPTRESAPTSVSVCLAYEHGGKCSGCRACWDPRIPVIAYVAHGVKMQKVVRLLAV